MILTILQVALRLDKKGFTRGEAVAGDIAWMVMMLFLSAYLWVQ